MLIRHCLKRCVNSMLNHYNLKENPYLCNLKCNKEDIWIQNQISSMW